MVYYVIFVMNMGAAPAAYIHTPLLNYVAEQLSLNRTVLLTGNHSNHVPCSLP